MSLKTVITGFLLGSLVGISCGFLISLNLRIKRAFLPIANFLRGLPSVAKVPLFIAIFGIGSITRIATVTVAVFFVVLLSTIEGFGNPSIGHLELIKIWKLKRLHKAFFITIPAAFPKIFSGLQSALQISVLVMVVSEMLGSGLGVGAYIFQAQSTFNIVQMWNGIFLLGTLGILLNYLFLYVERKFMPWNRHIGRDF